MLTTLCVLYCELEGFYFALASVSRTLFCFVLLLCTCMNCGPTFYSMLGSLNLTSVSVKGVAAALDKHTPKGETKGIKAFFRMDENGILNLEKVCYLHRNYKCRPVLSP